MSLSCSFFWGSLVLVSLGLFTGCGGKVEVAAGGGGAGGSGGAGGITGTGAGTATGSTGATSTGTATTTFGACTGPGQCSLVPVGCCWPCGIPAASDYVAVEGSQAAAYAEWVCPGGGECPLCDGGVNPDLFAYCEGGSCQVGNVPEHPVSACADDGDCVLRMSSSCCESCGASSSYELTAVSVTADPSLSELVCPVDSACPPCAPTYPAEAFAVCSEGHCEVAILE